MISRRLIKIVLAGLVLVVIALAGPLPQLLSTSDPQASHSDLEPLQSINTDSEALWADISYSEGYQESEQDSNLDRIPDVVFVPTPQDVVEKMLEMVKLTKDDLVYDLGCGDGRIVVTASKLYGCRSVGFDIDPQRIEESLENVRKNNLEDLVRIERADIFTLDLSEATVITLYLLQRLNVRLLPQLEQVKPGTRIVSHDFDLRDIVMPDEVYTMASEHDNYEHDIYLWIAPLEREDNGD